jgi:anti-sigma factor RsiW
MSDERNDNQDKRHDAREPSIAELLRRAADDELTRPQRALLDAHLAAHPEDAERLEFERALRKHVASAMIGARAPQDIRDAALRAMQSAAESDADDAPAPIVRRERSFWARYPLAAPLALAAALLLAISAGIIVQRTGSPDNIWLTEAQQASVVTFVDKEHNRCAAMECTGNPKWVANSLDTALAAMTDYMGVAPERLDLTDTGFTLTGAGPCHVPGDGKSMHLLYRSAQDLSAPSISLFIQETGSDTVIDASCLCDKMDVGEVLMWRRDGLAYYLVCPSDDVADLALATLGAPTRRSPI